MAYKQEIIKTVLVELAKDTKTSEIKEKHNISLSTIYNWKKKYSTELEIIKESLNIKTLIQSKDYQTAFNLASEEKFKDYFPIQSQLITILIKMKKLDDAYNLASDEKFKDYFPITYQKEQIYIILNKKEANKPQEKNNSNSFQAILIAIKNKTITEDMIINLDIYEWQKVILLNAFYEINNYSLNIIINYLKREQIIYQNNPDVLKILKKLLARIKTKPKFFDIEFYLTLINTSVNILPSEKDYLTNLVNNNYTCQNAYLRERKN